MPELAEVEYYRRQWNPGLGKRVAHVELHAGRRVTREVSAADFKGLLEGSRFLSSHAHGKRMLFRFSNELWLGIHLGMTGKLSIENAGFQPGRHDHVVLHLPGQALVFNDPRQFGRVQFHQGRTAPAWWTVLPPQPHENSFTRAHFETFAARHAKLPLKALLLDQAGCPGIGNWMADEILWRARLAPSRRVGTLAGSDLKTLRAQTQFVAKGALRHIAPAFDDPPRGWFFHERWGAKGHCPRDNAPLERATIGGRTTAWCPVCQPRVS